MLFWEWIGSIVALLFIFFGWIEIQKFRKMLRRRLFSRSEIILITGGASGLGKAMVLEFASLGFTVAVWDINKDALERIQEEAQEKGQRLYIDTVDVSHHNDVQLAALRLRKELGDIGILINNAGVVSAKSILELTEFQILKTFAVNTFSNFWTVRAFLPSMLSRRKGHIVTVASVLGHMGAAKLSDYCASKHACVGFHESLCMDLQDHPEIILTLICPATIATPMFNNTKDPIFAPKMTPEYVSSIVVDKILQGGGGTVFMPNIFYTMPIYRALPIRIKIFIARIFGVFSAMDKVQGTISSK